MSCRGNSGVRSGTAEWRQTIFPAFVNQAQNDKLIPSSRMWQAWPLPGLVNLSIHVSIWWKQCKTKSQSIFAACMPHICDWYFVRGSRESVWLHSLGLGGDGGEMCCEEIQGHPSGESSAELLLKSNTALKAQSPLSFLCQDGQSSSQTRYTASKGGFKSAAWGHLGSPGVRMGLEYGMWGRWHMETQRAQLPFSSTISFLQLMGQEELVCCGGNAAKTSAALISLPVLLCNSST